MKVGKLLLPNAEYHPGERAKIWINPDARPDETNPLNPYLLYEVPIRTSQFVGFIFTPDLIKGGRFDSTLIDSSRMLDQALLGTPDAKLDGTVVLDPTPLELQKLIENAAKDWKAFTKEGALFEGLTDVWIHQPEVFDKHIDRRKDPGSITRQNSFILMAWDVWEKQGLSLKERAADMKAQGYGDIEPKALEKRAARLKLTSNRSRKC